MKKPSPLIPVFALVFFFFVQAAGTLVESIYILDLMNTSLDEKALGVLFFFAPLLLIPFYKKYSHGMAWVAYALLLIGRGMLPYLKTSNQVIASGIAVFGSLSLTILLLNSKSKGETHVNIESLGAAGLALGVGLSAFLRTWGHGLDSSLTRAGGWVGLILALLLGALLSTLTFQSAPKPADKPRRIVPALLGLYLVLTLVWFAFSAPAVIARWTEGNYTLIVILVSLPACAWVALSFLRPNWMERLSPGGLLLWNIFFALSLTATLLTHRVAFPPTPDSPPVVVTSPGLLAQIPLVLMLLLYPVIFADLRGFLGQLRGADISPRQLATGIFLGGLIVILLVFAHIFTNVWGYVKPVSPFFRNLFWLPYFFTAALLPLLAWISKSESTGDPSPAASIHWAWMLLPGALLIGAGIGSLPGDHVQVQETKRNSIVVMTFNTQQSNDDFGERSFEDQLALIRKISPDVLALQESDSTRISLNNNDYVRYFAENLGYYSYYGPKTVTGTYGTALLSKYPLLDPRTVFMYSDKDEIGVTEAEIEVDGIRFAIYNVHPDGSDIAMLSFARTLLARARDKSHVIALGDYNLRDYEESYQLIAGVWTNAWVSIYPTEIGADGVDMSGENRIDHIFISPGLSARNPNYILPPESTTDHPVHWAEIYWEDQ